MSLGEARAENPFPGLSPYRRGRELFGRDRDLVLFKDRLYSARTSLLFAASGVGKSSFLDAKVVPAIEGAHFVVMHARWGGRAPLAALRATWIQALARTLSKTPAARERWLPSAQGAPGAAGAPGSAGGDEAALALELERLWPEASSPAAFARRFAALDTVLILDQFEEPLNSQVDDAGVDSLVAALADLINAAELRLRVVFSMRQEFLAELSLFENRVPDLFANYYHLRHPTPEQAVAIITRTVESAGVAVALDGVTALVDDLLDIGGLQSRAGPTGPAPRLRYVVPPVLQIVCSRLWKRDAARLGERAHAFAAGYRSGEASAFVRAFIDELIEKLAPAERRLLGKSLDFLVSRQGGKIAYEVGVLAQYLEAEPAALDGALTKLATEPDRVLRRTERSDGSIWYELYHDAYAGTLAAWKAELDAAQKREQLARERTTARHARWFGYAVAALIVTGVVYGKFFASARPLVEVLATDDYKSAKEAYASLSEMTFRSGQAERLWAGFWDRRAQAAALSELRENALVYALEALAIDPTPERRRVVAEAIGTDLGALQTTHYLAERFLALDRDGRRIALESKGIVRVLDTQSGEPVGAPLRIGGESLEARFSDDGNVLWLSGEEPSDSSSPTKGAVQPYEQRPIPVASPPLLIAWDVEAGREIQRWSAEAEPALTVLERWRISGDGQTALLATTPFAETIEGAWVDPRREAFGSAVERRLSVLGATTRREVVIPSLETTPLGQFLESDLDASGSHWTYPLGGNQIAVESADGSRQVLTHGSSPFTVPMLMDLSRDGARLVSVTATPRDSGEDEMQLWVWDVATSTPLDGSPAALAEEPESIELSPDGDRCLIGYWTAREVWSTAALRKLDRLEIRFSLSAFFAGDSDDLAASGEQIGLSSLLLVRWDAERHASRLLTVDVARGNPAGLSAIAAPGHSAGLVSVIGSDSQTRWRRWLPDEDAKDSQDASERGDATHPWWPDDVKVSATPSGSMIAVSVGSPVEFIDPRTRMRSHAPLAIGTVGSPSFLELDLEARRLVCNGEKPGIWDVRSGEKLHAFDEGAFELYSARSLANGKHFVASTDKGLKLLAWADGSVVRNLGDEAQDGFNLPILAVNRRGDACASVEESGPEEGRHLRIRSVATGLELGSLLLLEVETASALALDERADYVAVCSVNDAASAEELECTLRIFEVRTGAELPGATTRFQGIAFALAFTPDGRAVVARGCDRVVRIPLDAGPENPPVVRFLPRQALIFEGSPHWFGDDPTGSTLRLPTLDSGGRIVLHSVSFGDRDGEEIKGDPASLRAEWGRRLALGLDDNGRVKTLAADELARTKL